MLHRRFLLSATSLLTVLVLAQSAAANCARPVSYSVKISDNKVTIEPTNFSQRGCPDSSGMLRENVATGELVKLDDFCSSAASAEVLSAYVDECVPAGSYRYGFATPYACLDSACSTDFFAPATVETTLPANCVRSNGNDGPTSATSKPWVTDATICTYHSKVAATGGAPNQAAGGASIGAPGGGGNSTTSGGTAGIVAPAGGQTSVGGATIQTGVGGSATGGKANGLGGIDAKAGAAGTSLAAGGTQSDDTSNDSDSGCSISAPTGSSTVLVVNLLAILAGVVLRRKHRTRDQRSAS